MTIMITGGTGQLGTELRKLLDERDQTYFSVNSTSLDVTDRQAVFDFVEKLRPSVIYHCAAYTTVDAAEDEGKEDNWKVNAEGTRTIAEAAEAVGATLVYISTDYVFNGEKTAPYEVNDMTNPQTAYGRAKLEGERFVQQLVSKGYIIRTSWVFGEYGKNFVFTMKRLAETHSSLTVVDDQKGRPTWTRTLAEFMIYLVDQKEEYGIYHLSNDGSCTWYDFAKEILKNTDVNIEPVDSSQFPQKAQRPKNSILDLSKTKAVGFVVPPWEEALEKFLQTIDTKSDPQ